MQANRTIPSPKRAGTFFHSHGPHQKAERSLYAPEQTNTMYIPPLKVLLPTTVVLWLAIALFNTGIFIFSFDEGVPVYDFFYGFRWTPLYHSPWLVVIPCILFLARKFPLNEKISLKNLSIHLVLALGITFLTSFAHTFFIHIRLGEPFQYSSLFGNYLFYFDDRFLLYFVIMVGYYAVDYYQKQNRESLRELQLQETISREKLNSFKNDIQPAFLLNTLKDIQGRVPDNPFLAEKLIADLAQMIRKLLHNSQKKDIRTEDDLIFLKSYIAILSVRLGKKIQFQNSIKKEDKKKNITISLFVISVVEDLLNRDKQNFSSLDRFVYEIFSTEGEEKIQVTLEQLRPSRPDFEKWIKNEGAKMLTTPFTEALKNREMIALQATENGALTISITRSKNA